MHSPAHWWTPSEFLLRDAGPIARVEPLECGRMYSEQLSIARRLSAKRAGEREDRGHDQERPDVEQDVCDDAGTQAPLPQIQRDEDDLVGRNFERIAISPERHVRAQVEYERDQGGGHRAAGER